MFFITVFIISPHFDINTSFIFPLHWCLGTSCVEICDIFTTYIIRHVSRTACLHLCTIVCTYGSIKLSRSTHINTPWGIAYQSYTPTLNHRGDEDLYSCTYERCMKTNKYRGCIRWYDHKSMVAYTALLHIRFTVCVNQFIPKGCRCLYAYPILGVDNPTLFWIITPAHL